MHLRAYQAAFRARFLQVLQYRVAALSGFTTQCWWGAIKVMVLHAFFANGRSSQHLNEGQAISYVWLAQGLLALIPWGSDPDIALAVRSGNIAIDRLRPVDTYAWWFWRTAAWLVGRAVPRALLMLLMAAVLLPLLGLGHYGLQWPHSAFHGVWFCVSLLLAVLLATAVNSLVNAVAVVTMSDRGPNILFSPIITLLSGNELPLGLFPEALQTFLFLQPFAGLFDIPFRGYLGALSFDRMCTGLCLQAGWLLALCWLGRTLLERALGRVEVQGG